MKTCSLLFFGLAGVLVAGCNHKVASTPQSAALVPALADSAEEAVPRPAQTPFDGNPKARAIYLEYYAMGYGFATTDYASPGCMCTTEGDPERYEAAWNGFIAGKEAGSAALANKRQQNQAPIKAVSDPLTATPPSPRQ